MGINIHDPLVQIKGTFLLYSHIVHLTACFSLPCSYRISLWLCSDMHDLAPPMDPEDTLLVGRRLGLFLSHLVYPTLLSPKCNHVTLNILFFSLFIQIATVFMHVEHPSDLSRLSRIVAYYLMCVTFYAVIWSARISILFSIIRIDPDPFMRQRLKWLAAAFVGAIGFFIAQLFWICESNHDDWKNTASPQCHLPKQVPICQLVCTYPFTSLSPFAVFT